MPVTRSQSTENAAQTLLSMKRSSVIATRFSSRRAQPQQEEGRPRREAAVRARELLKLYIESDEE